MNDATGFQVYRRSDCRICGSKNLVPYLDLGDQPPSNSFINEENIALEQSFPLQVVLCMECGLSQLRDVVSAADIFDDYLYLASTSKALCAHYEKLVGAALARFAPPDNALMIDIGCNDGILLKGYPGERFRLLGVEPSSAGEYARTDGFEIIPDFFNEDTGKRIMADYGRAAIVTATNVFAHVDDISSFARGIRTVLDDDGVFIIEFPYLGEMLEHCYFDTIYHEHLSYLALSPLIRLFSDTGLRAVRVERTELGASGPALRLFVCRDESTHETEPSIADLVAEEESWGVRSLARYNDFAAQVAMIKSELNELIKTLRNTGHRVGAYCAPAKGNTLLNYLGLGAEDLVAVSENNDLKIGKFTPGSHIPIVSDPAFIDAGVTHALLLAWNYADFFLTNAEFVKQGGKFVVPLPRPEIRP